MTWKIDILVLTSFVSNHLIFRLTTLYSLTGLTNNKIESWDKLYWKTYLFAAISVDVL